MRKIEQQMLNAIKNKTKYWNKDNTRIEFVSVDIGKFERTEVYLHGNHIADYWHKYGELKVNLDTLRRWPSMTTRSRLRALGANLVSIKGTLHLDGKSIYAE